MKIIIIEDQSIAAEELSFLISDLRPNYKIIKVLPSVKEAVNFMNDFDYYDLIFSDIQLIDGLSFEVFQQVKVKVPVIFCTAYDKFALDAFNANGISYILKPFSRQVLGNALDKFESFTSLKNNQLANLLKYLSPKTSISKDQSVLVHQRDRIIPIRLDNIAYLKLDFGVVNLFTYHEEKYVVSESLNDFEKLDEMQFFRANRQFLINRKAVKNAIQYFNRKLIVTLKLSCPDQIIISKEKSAEFLKWLANT